MNIRRRIRLLTAAMPGIILLSSGCTKQAAATKPADAASNGSLAKTGDVKRSGKVAKATFGAGCFWGVEAAFGEVPGVLGTAVGYAGGSTKNPTYRDVCTDRTGHAEVVQIEYDPTKVAYDQLLDIFWKVHDPTQVNRQGPDHGKQYRTVVFYHDAEQEKLAKASKARLEKSERFSEPIATQIVPAGEFYAAEEYHQKYLAKRGLASCHLPGEK